MADTPDAKTIYDQDCQHYRYQDALKWSRFQTATAIEAAMIYGLYQTQYQLRGFEFRALALFGSFLVLIICILSLKDNIDSQSYLDRIKKFEEGGTPFHPHWKGVGHLLMCVAIALITVFNIGLTARMYYFH